MTVQNVLFNIRPPTCPVGLVTAIPNDNSCVVDSTLQLYDNVIVIIKVHDI